MVSFGTFVVVAEQQLFVLLRLAAYETLFVQLAQRHLLELTLDTPAHHLEQQSLLLLLRFGRLRAASAYDLLLSGRSHFRLGVLGHRTLLQLFSMLEQRLDVLFADAHQSCLVLETRIRDAPLVETISSLLGDDFFSDFGLRRTLGCFRRRFVVARLRLFRRENAFSDLLLGSATSAFHFFALFGAFALLVLDTRAAILRNKVNNVYVDGQ